MKKCFLFFILIIIITTSCKTTYISAGGTLDIGKFAQSAKSFDDPERGYGFNIEAGQGWNDEDMIIANFSFLGYSETGSDGTKLYFGAIEYAKFKKINRFRLMYGGGIGQHLNFPITIVIPARIGLFYEFPREKNFQFHVGIIERPQFYFYDKKLNNGLTLTAGVRF